MTKHDSSYLIYTDSRKPVKFFQPGQPVSIDFQAVFKYKERVDQLNVGDL
jgi:hypothetical protein